jgi:hypothetical protein
LNHKNKPKVSLVEGNTRDPWRRLREKTGVKLMDTARMEP